MNSITCRWIQWGGDSSIRKRQSISEELSSVTVFSSLAGLLLNLLHSITNHVCNSGGSRGHVCTADR